MDESRRLEVSAEYEESKYSIREPDEITDTFTFRQEDEGGRGIGKCWNVNFEPISGG